MRRRVLAFALGAALVAPACAEPVQLNASPIELRAARPDVQELGKLHWRGGIHMTSGDSRFGGYSGLEALPDGRLVAVSDLGHWLVFRPVMAGGRLVGAAEGDIEPLKDERGRPFDSKTTADAESLRRHGADFLVGFERRHRVLRYATVGGPGIPIAPPPDIKDQPRNGGIETIAFLPRGRVLLISEQARDASDNLKAWLNDAGTWHALAYRSAPGFQPTDAAALVSGDLLVLERRFTLFDAPAARLLRVPAEQIVPGATMEGAALAEWADPYVVENLEGLALSGDRDGGTLVWIISDDNKNPLQRTLLMLFRLD